MKLKFTLLAVFCYLSFFGQSFKEVHLPKPQYVSPFYIGPLFTSTIHYGAKPSNFNGKVIVFNHGYIDLNQSQFLFDNSFYQNVYDEGYLAVFVATTRGQGIWVNGELLAEAIDIITNKYNVEQVTLVAHSNGGKACEAAMFHYGKKDKVSQVFALGTPYYGTYLADISQLPLLKWAWSLTGLNEGARTSTTYYCRDVVRPYFDNKPNNQPGKFTVLGSSGFYKGSTIAAAAFLLTGGVILPVQGANDGVAPYSSTRRPGALNVFSKNDSRAIFDHLDVSLGKFSWRYVRAHMINKSSKFEDAPFEEINRRISSSDYYLIHSANDYEKISFDEGVTSATIDIIHETPKSKLQLFSDQKALYTGSLSDGHSTSLKVTQPDTQIKSDSRFLAYVRQNSDLKMYLEDIPNHEASVLKVDFKSENGLSKSIANTRVIATITKTSEIDGTEVNEEPVMIEFSNKDNAYYYNTSTLEDGVYSLLLTGEAEGKFKRSLISGFVVGNVKASLSNSTQINPETAVSANLMLYPTVVKDQAYLEFNNNLSSNTKAQIFTFDGKQVKTFELSTIDQKKIDVSQHLRSLPKGIYLLKVGSTKTVKFIKD